MGALGLLIPTVFAAAGLALLLITFLDQVTQSSSLLSSLHFLELNTTNLSIPTSSTVASTAASAITANLADTYTIGLWNACATYANGSTICSTPVAAYAFDPLTTFGLSDETSTTIEALLPAQWAAALATYRAASKWLFAAYCAALALAATTVLTGLLACALSRASACCTALLAALAALFAIAASATATALFLTVEHLIDDKLGAYGIAVALGTRLLALSWAGAACMLAGAVAWLFACCCCSGSRDRKRHRHSGERASDYEPLVGAHRRGAAQGMAQQRSLAQWHGQQGKTAYEPVYGREQV